MNLCFERDAISAEFLLALLIPSHWHLHTGVYKPVISILLVLLILSLQFHLVYFLYGIAHMPQNLSFQFLLRASF